MSPGPIAVLAPSRAGLSVGAALAAATARPRIVWSRGPRAGVDEVGEEGLRRALERAAWVVVAPRDDALRELSARAASLAPPDGSERLALHLSGAAGIDVLDPFAARGYRVAVLHPLRPFPAAESGSEALRGVFCGLRGAATEELAAACRAAGARPLLVAEEERVRYHRGAAVASNAIVALLDLARRDLERAGLDADDARAVAGSLAERAVGDVLRVGAEAALTGPLARGDERVVAAHLAVGEDLPGDGALLRALFRATLRVAERSGGLDESTRNALRHLLESDLPA
ncbi:MAG: DUF2520 domain-containing protein [Planctomycetota bacterium]